VSEASAGEGAGGEVDRGFQIFKVWVQFRKYWSKQELLGIRQIDSNLHKGGTNIALEPPWQYKFGDTVLPVLLIN
jgi:hypothetical protein